MKKIHLFTAIALLLVLSSCLSTIQPIFTEKDLVFDPRMIGKWGVETQSTTEPLTPQAQEQLKHDAALQSKAKTVHKATVNTTDKEVNISYSGYAEITKASAKDVEAYPGLQKLVGKIYLVKYLDDKGAVTNFYYGFLVKLGQKFYMDYFPAESEAVSKYNTFYKSHYVKLHTCYSIRFLKDNSFELKQFDARFLKDLIDNKKIRIRHELRDDDSFIVTASTQELQQYIIKYSDVPEAYYKDNSSTYTKVQNN